MSLSNDHSSNPVIEAELATESWGFYTNFFPGDGIYRKPRNGKFLSENPYMPPRNQTLRIAHLG